MLHRRAYVAHEQVASGQTALHIHDVPDVSQAVPAPPSLAFTAPTISETATGKTRAHLYHISVPQGDLCACVMRSYLRSL